ncbi:MAG: hypothetical protein RL302_1693 [Pseudomonadota bacterium]|jgi:uncharacterized protein (TIGR02246 family)
MKSLAVLQAEAACRELVLQAAQAVDSSDYAGFVALFFPDGVLVRPDGSKLQGREAIVQAYQARDPNRLTQHLVSNQQVEVNQATGTAVARCKVLLWSGQRSAVETPKGRPADAMAQVGEMVDEMALTPEGWRIRTRQARFIFYST